MNPDIESDIKSRTPPGWDGLSAPKGWDKLIEELHLRLVSLNPKYEVHQIKEKFGGLRYYCEGTSQEMNHLISKAESKSYSICMNCGAEDAEQRNNNGWISTLCNSCAP